MKQTSICAALIVALGVSATSTAVWAQIRDDLAAPAELPPEGYDGRQYVDSRGCVYIRAGIDGNVTWVPRVDRNREVICGTATASSAPAAEPAPAPIETVAPAPAPAASAAAPRELVRATPAAKPKAAKPQAAKPKVVRRRAAPAASAGPRRVSVAPVVPAPAPQVIVRRAGQLPANTVLRTPEGLKKGPTVVVRATGKTVRVADAGVTVYASSRGTTALTGQTVIAPKRAYERGASVAVPVPQGYKPAFDDGRLSTTRAHQTLDGRRRMLLTWTNTVPRRLVDQYTGEEVSQYFPELRYPHRSMKEQQAAGVVSTRGTMPAAAPKAQRQSVPQVARRAAPSSKPAAASASHRYIQVGTFSTPAKAQAAIRRVQAAGLPVRVKQIARAGAAHQMVVVGPFARQDQLSTALETVRNRIGYRAARLQN